MSLRPTLQHRFEMEHSSGIDLSPLLDVVFILLIFFIVTTVFVRETGVEIDRPRALSAQQLPQSVILIAITGGGEVIYGGNAIGARGVRNTLEPLVRERQRPVVIQADKSASAEMLVEVLDQARLAGAANVSIATRVEG